MRRATTGAGGGDDARDRRKHGERQQRCNRNATLEARRGRRAPVALRAAAQPRRREIAADRRCRPGRPRASSRSRRPSDEGTELRRGTRPPRGRARRSPRRQTRQSTMRCRAARRDDLAGVDWTPLRRPRWRCRSRQPRPSRIGDDRHEAHCSRGDEKRRLDAEARNENQSGHQAAGNRARRVGGVQHADPGAQSVSAAAGGFHDERQRRPHSAEGTISTGERHAANQDERRVRRELASDEMHRGIDALAARRASPASPVR